MNIHGLKRAIRPSARYVQAQASASVRGLATPSSSGSGSGFRNEFSQALADGPSLDDFISDPSPAPERVVLGNTKGYVPLVAHTCETHSTNF